MSNVIQSHLFSRWQQALLLIKLSKINKLIENESNETLSFNQVSPVFYILLFCLSFSLGILLIEVLFFKSIN